MLVLASETLIRRCGGVDGNGGDDDDAARCNTSEQTSEQAGQQIAPRIISKIAFARDAISFIPSLYVLVREGTNECHGTRPERKPPLLLSSSPLSLPLHLVSVRGASRSRPVLNRYFDCVCGASRGIP